MECAAIANTATLQWANLKFYMVPEIRRTKIFSYTIKMITKLEQVMLNLQDKFFSSQGTTETVQVSAFGRNFGLAEMEKILSHSVSAEMKKAFRSHPACNPFTHLKFFLQRAACLHAVKANFYGMQPKYRPTSSQMSTFKL